MKSKLVPLMVIYEPNAIQKNCLLFNLQQKMQKSIRWFTHFELIKVPLSFQMSFPSFSLTPLFASLFVEENFVSLLL